ncbi:MAG: sugar phosphate isomerase/epimerase [Clostridiales bacterium]|nr:sugar phosphate isomerase/epimerase [Clostridiales bacterium]
MKISVFYSHVREAAAQAACDPKDLLPVLTGAGITGLEMDLNELNDLPGTRAMLEEAGIEVSNICCMFRWENGPDPVRTQALLDAAAYLGCRKIMPIPGFFPEGCDRDVVLEHMAANLAELYTAAHAAGLIVSLEDYDNAASPIATASGMKWFADRVPGVGFTFDTGNFNYAGEDELEDFELLKDRILHVHCKDRADRSLSGEAPQLTVDGRKIYPCAFGSGFIRTDEILERLKSIGYDDYLTIEHYGAADQLNTILQSARYLRRALQ